MGDLGELKTACRFFEIIVPQHKKKICHTELLLDVQRIDLGGPGSPCPSVARFPRMDWSITADQYQESFRPAMRKKERSPQ
jgi:hypothetical protein